MTPNAGVERYVGIAALEAGQPQLATEAFVRATALDANEPVARVGLAALAVSAADAGAALGLLEGLSSPQAQVVRARALLLRGAAGDAEAVIALAAAEPSSVALGYLEGSALLVLGRFADAQRRFEAVEQLDRKSPLAAYGLARLAAAQRRSTDVLLYLRTARTLSREQWRAEAVASDPAFAFLAAEPAFIDVVGP